MRYPLHPITDEYEEFNETELSAFRASLSKDGLKVPVVIWQGQIVDGRYRVTVCGELGIELRYHDITQECRTEEQMRAHVRALNEHRRANTKPKTRAENRRSVETAVKAHPDTSDRSIAEKVRVDDKTVASVRTTPEASAERSKNARINKVLCGLRADPEVDHPGDQREGMPSRPLWASPHGPAQLKKNGANFSLILGARTSGTNFPQCSALNVSLNA
jgi:ParB-like chromosome segregation protein Spo0J